MRNERIPNSTITPSAIATRNVGKRLPVKVQKCRIACGVCVSRFVCVDIGKLYFNTELAETKRKVI